MSNLRKLFFVAVSVMTVFGVVGFVPTGAKAAAAGSLIKMAGNSAVYYFDGTKRFVFPQENVYKSWYKDFSGVMTVSQSELQSYPIGGNVTMRPGTWMVKITTDPKVYVVTPGGALHWVDSEARAIALYGANWNKMIVDVSDAFFVNYSTGTALSSNVHPDGTLIKVGTQYYYVMSGTKRPFASDAALTANMMNTAFAVETTISYPDGSSITGAETAITNVAGSASSSVGTSAAGLTVSGGTMTASTSLPKGANAVNVGSWNFAAGPEGAVTLNSVTFKRTGVGNVTDISAAYVYDGANRLTSGRTFNTSTNEVTFTLNQNIPAGSTKTLSLKVNILCTGAACATSSASSGDQHVFGIASATAVSSNAASVNGVFPINSNTHSIAGAVAGTIDIERASLPSDPRVGDMQVLVSEFRLTADTEDAYVNQVTLTQGGNIANSGMSNFVLKQNGTNVASASAVATNDRLDLVFNPAFKIERGNNRIFQLYTDIGGRPDDTLGFYVDDTADVVAAGGTFGVGMNATIDSTFNDATDTQLTLQGGQFTITFDGPSSTNISNAASDQVIWKGTVYSANQVDIRNWRFGLADTTAAGGGLCDSSSVCYVQDVKVWNLDNNTVIAGPLDFTPAAHLGETGDGGSIAYLPFTDDYTMNAGQTMHIGLSVDIRNTPASSVLGLVARMGDGASHSFTQNDIKNVGSNTYLTQGTDVVPGSEIVGQTQTVVAGGLTVTTAASPSGHIMIKGANTETAGAFNFAAGSGSAVKVNTVQVKAVTDTDGAALWGADGVGINDLILTAKLMDGTTQVGTTKSFSVSSSIGTATFDNLNWNITASQTKTLSVVLNTNSAATLDTSPDYLKVYIAASGVTAVDAQSNSIDTVPSSQQNGPTITVKDGGTLAASIAPTPTNPAASLIVAGSTDKVLAAFKFQATDDSFYVKKLNLITSSTAATARVATAKVRYPTQSSGTVTQTFALSNASTDNQVDISSAPMYVAQNGSATLEVLIDAAQFVNNDGTENGVNSAGQLNFTLDANATAGLNQATGVASNTDSNSWGSDVSGNTHEFYRTVLTVAAGSGTPNNTARTRSASQNIASYNLSASSNSDAFIRGSLKAADSSANPTGEPVWTATGGGTAATITTATNYVSGASAITTGAGTAATAGTLSYDFGASHTDLSAYKRLSAWVKVTLSAGASTVKLATDDTAALASPQDESGAITADATWQYVDMALSTTDANTRYVGIEYTSAGGGNTVTVTIDDMRFYTDSVIATVAGDLNATAPQALLFTLKDSGGTTRAYGAYNGTTATGTVKLIAGDGVDTDNTQANSAIEVASTALALDLVTSSSGLMHADQSGIAESLSVTVTTGTTGSDGNFSWYDNSDSAGSDNMAAITVVNPTSTTITFANTY